VEHFQIIAEYHSDDAAIQTIFKSRQAANEKASWCVAQLAPIEAH
jgi:hypothetical protein